MLGLNSGLLGVRRVPTTGSASGMWIPNEQVLAQRAGIWASLPLDPLSLSPVAWWDASDASTITTSSGLITEWDDKSGNGWDLTQTTSSQRPAYSTAAINGLNAALWPSSDNDDTMVTAAGSFAFKEVYVVLEYDGTSFSNYDGILGARNDDWYISGAGSGVGLLLPGGMGAYINGNNGTNRATNVFSEISSPCLLRLTTATTQITYSGAEVGMDRYYTSLNRGWSGYIAEILVFSTQLSAGDRTSVDTYLKNKWGI